LIGGAIGLNFASAGVIFAALSIAYDGGVSLRQKSNGCRRCQTSSPSCPFVAGAARSSRHAS
jgi:hypothetical protein